MWDYTDTVHDHFLNPRNAGSIQDANAIGEVGSLACGDALKLYLKIDDQGLIQDAKFQTFGCASAIASSSALTELIKGKKVDEALKVSNREIAEFLGGLPKEKMHCSVMGQEALEAAIRNWRGEVPLPAAEGHTICKCFGVTDVTVRRAVQENGLKTLEDIIDYTKAGGACGQCHDDLQALLDETLARMQIEAKEGGAAKSGEPASAVQENLGRAAAQEANDLNIITARPKLTNLQRMQMVMQVLENDIRPRLHQDGGDVELVDLDGKTVYVELLAMCKGCPSGQQTLKDFIEKTLREKVEPDLIVEEAS